MPKIIANGSDFMQLRSFEQMAKRLDFWKASRDLGMSRGSLTRYITILENRMGKKLLEKKCGSINLTGDGQILLRKVQSSILNIEEVIKEIDNTAN